MGWFGYGWHNRVPETARQVAKAWMAGKERKRGNAESCAGGYWLCNSKIAIRPMTDEEIAHAVEMTLRHGEPYKIWREPQFSFGGWPTKMTARHLNACGIKAEVRRAGPRGKRYDVALLEGRIVDSNGWYTKSELLARPEWVEPVTPRRVRVSVPVPVQPQLEFA